jgi:alkylation response protein AidB-like acyl-CoA dehydrogenase
VIDAERADYIAVVRPGPSVAVIERRQVEPVAIESLDFGRRVFSIDVPDRLEAAAMSNEALEGLIERATVALSAESVGASRWLLDHSVAYAKERVQFDKPIGSFQGLQWKLVAMAQDHERAAAAVAYAAMAIDADDRDRTRAVHVAKAAAGRAGRHSARDGMQVHGGIGYTWEHDLHLFLRRAEGNDALLGSATWHQDRLGELLLS